MARNRKRGRVARVFERADHALLKEYDFHPIEDMIKTAQSLEGVDRVAACHKIAQYFYPPLKATEQKIEQTNELVIKLGQAAHSD